MDTTKNKVDTQDKIIPRPQNTPFVGIFTVMAALPILGCLCISVVHAGTASISGAPNPCIIPSGGSQCTSTISGRGTVPVKVYLGNTLFTTSGTGTYFTGTAPWITPTGRTFTVKDAVTGATLATKAVYGACASGTTWNGSVCSAVTSGSISADPVTLPLSQGAQGSTVLYWSSTNASEGAQVYVSTNGGAEQLFASGVSGSKTANWIQYPNKYEFKLYSGGSRPALLKSVTVTTSLADSPSKTCSATSFMQFQECVKQLPASGGTISLAANISCTGDACCPGGLKSLPLIYKKSNILINGNGYVISRKDHPRECPVLRMAESDKVTIKNVTFDEGADGNYCTYTDNCATTLQIREASAISLSGVKILHAKDSPLSADGVTGLTIDASEVYDAGVHGYVIWDSTGVKITNSKISRVRVNGLVLGTRGELPNLVERNTITQSHYHGLWPAYAGVGITPGGMVYVPQADNLVFRNNTIHGAYCENCGFTLNGVYYVAPPHAIELCEPDSTEPHPGGSGCLTNTRIEKNTISNVDHAITQNGLSKTLGSTVSIVNNKLINWGINANNPFRLQNPSTDAVIISGNLIKPTLASNWFEDAVDYYTWTQGGKCLTASSVARSCPGEAGAWEGSCMLRVQSGAQTCTNSPSLTTQGWSTPVPSTAVGSSLYLDLYYRLSVERKGQACLIFKNNSGKVLLTTCKTLNSAPEWRFTPMDTMVVKVPYGAVSVETRFGVLSPNTTIDLDNVRLAW